MRYSFRASYKTPFGPKFVLLPQFEEFCKKLFLLFFVLLLASCSHKAPETTLSSTETSIGIPPKEPLIKVNYIDMNGISETIVNPDRLRQFANTPLCSSQTYKKLLRIYKKDAQGNARSILTSYYDNGTLHQYLECMNTRASGWYGEWHENGQKKLQAYILAGLADLNEAAIATWSFQGEARVWNDQGELTAVCQYDHGKLSGEYCTYNAEGSLASRSFWKNGKQEGQAFTYYPSGDIRESYFYENGLREGKAEGFFTGKRPLFEEWYEDDSLRSGTYYLPNGRILSRVQSGQGVRSLFEEERLSYQHEVKEGKPEGRFSFFDRSGKLEKTYFIRDGKKEGQETWYYTDTGQKKREFSWVMNEIHGEVQTWYPNGRLESKKEMAHNQKQGVSTCWYLDGQLMLVEEYHADKLIRGKYLRRGSSEPVSSIEKGSGTATLFDPSGTFIEAILYRDSLPEIKE